MAPVLIQPSHAHFPLHTTRSIDTTSPTGPKYFSLKVLVQLFAITIFIFVIAVLFWKLGSFFRFLTQDRVVKRGNMTTARYARTWYGWVPAAKHTGYKEFLRNCFGKFRKWTAWRSSNQDYRWVWWDPGQQELNRYRETKYKLRWLPNWIRSYSFTTADTIWNPGPLRPAAAIPEPGSSRQSLSSRMAGALSSRHTLDRVVGSRYTMSRTSICTRVSIKVYLQDESNGAVARIDASAKAGNESMSRGEELRRPVHFQVEARRTMTLAQTALSFKIHPLQRNLRPNLSRSLSLPCLDRLTEPSGPHDDPKARWPRHRTASPYSDSRARHRPSHPHAYHIQATRVDFHTDHFGPFDKSARVPKPDSLARILSDFTPVPTGVDITRQSSAKASSSKWSSLPFDSRTRDRAANATPFRHRELSPDLARRGYGTNLSGYVCHERRSGLFLPSLEAQFDRSFLRDSLSMVMKSPEHVHDAQGSIASHKKEVVEGRETALNNVTDTRLGDCDVQLIDDLNRRLKWLSNQLSPGRRPYHFALLANHWLNTETWIVIDPPTRISIDARRRLGDPRFNDPYPAVDWTPRPKYPKTQRKTANVPKINSWRAAVNRNRKACGFDDVIKGVELFEGSADTPPDGKVDPACWILRKPPQGFSISSRQGTVFYEGGAGWQETLDDWQKVRRGYRIRKAIHEGRVNRKRAKEIALGITRYYRLSVPKVS